MAQQQQSVVSQYDSCWVDKYTFFSNPYNMDASMIEKEDPYISLRQTLRMNRPGISF